MKKQEYILSKESVSKALFNLSAPAMVGMLVVAIYNLADTIFIGRGVGTLGIAGVAIVFPIQMIVMALAQTIGIGGSSIISRKIGAQKKDEAEHVLGNIFLLVFLTSIIMMISGLVFLQPLLNLFGVTDTIMPFAFSYAQIILLGTVFFSFTMAGNNVIRAEGNAKASMVIMLIGTVLNIIFDPIFIFGFDMGMAGAAFATVLSQFIAFLFIVYYFLGKKSILRLIYKNFKLKMLYVKEIFAIGSSTFVRMSAGSIMALVLNNTLAVFGGDLAIATFGVVNRLLAFLLMPIFGVVQGMQPLVGYSFGAKNINRVREIISLSIKVTTVMSFVSFVVLFLFSRQLLNIFSTDNDLIDLGVHITRIIVIFLSTIGFQMIIGGMYQAIGKAKEALVLSSLRQVILLIPLILILPHFFGLDGVWYSFFIADFIAAIVTWYMYKHEMRVILLCSPKELEDYF